jgi:hypothetical protein
MHLFLLGAAFQSVDLSTIERKIAKEPKYGAAEQYYALLVLGPEAERRIWFVVDGENLFIDTNANGDLTEPGEKFVASTTRGPESLSSLSREWQIPKLATSDRYTNIKVTFDLLNPEWRPEKSATNFVEMERFMGVVGKTPHANVSNIYVTIGGSRTQFCNAMFTTKPAAAPIFHMDAPLTIGVLETIVPHELGRRPGLKWIQVAVGTPGFGGDQPGCFSYIMYADFPSKERPVLEIEFLAADGKRLPPQRFTLDGKC